MKSKNQTKTLRINKLTVSNLNETRAGGAGTIGNTYDMICITQTIGPCTTDGQNFCIPELPTTTA